MIDPESRVRLVLKAGDCHILENHPSLHDRTGMNPVAGQSRKFRRFDVERGSAQTQFQRLAARTSRQV